MQKGFFITLCLLAGVSTYADREAWTWGANSNGQLGDNTTTDRWTAVLVLGTGGSGYLTDVTAIAAGYLHSLALKSDGTVWAWGKNDYGQLGDNTTTDRWTPVQVKGSGGSGYLTGIIAITAGSWYSLALKSDGTVWGWGQNTNGELGDNTNTTRLTPVQVSGLSGVTAIAAGYYHSLAMKSDNTVWGWGYNGWGTLGDNTQTDRWTPVQVKGSGGSGYLTGIIAITAGGGGIHSLALKSDNTVWTWGCNTYGQLGDNTTTTRLTPVQVSGLSGVTAIAAGYQHSLALKSDGTVWAWGLNNLGQLGDNTGTDCHTPVQVKGTGGSGNLTGIIVIAGGYDHSLALKSDNTVWTWGWNGNGQLGDNTITNRLSPVQVLGGQQGGTYLTSINKIAGGGWHSLVIQNSPLGTELFGFDADMDGLSLIPSVGNRFFIKYDVPRIGDILTEIPVSLKLYDVSGSVNKVLFNGTKSFGSYTMNLDLSNSRNGIYFLRLDVGNKYVAKKLILISR